MSNSALKLSADGEYIFISNNGQWTGHRIDTEGVMLGCFLGNPVLVNKSQVDNSKLTTYKVNNDKSLPEKTISLPGETTTENHRIVGTSDIDIAIKRQDNDIQDERSNADSDTTISLEEGTFIGFVGDLAPTLQSEQPVTA